jgi:hypothetical protein
LAVIPPLGAQDVLDAGTLEIRRGDSVIGREEFTVRRGRDGDRDGLTIASTVTYVRSDRGRRHALVEVNADFEAVLAQFDLQGEGAGQRLLISVLPRRITIRAVTPSSESTREYPRRGHAVVIDDESYGAFGALARLRAGPIHAIPASGERPSLVQLTDRASPDPTMRVRVLGPAVNERWLYFDEQGRLRRVELPAQGIVAARLPDAP